MPSQSETPVCKMALGTTSPNRQFGVVATDFSRFCAVATGVLTALKPSEEKLGGNRWHALAGRVYPDRLDIADKRPVF